LDEINQKIQSGEISLASTQAWYDGSLNWAPLATLPGVVKPTRPPPLPPTGVATADATGGIIPYKNPLALTAYYLGLFGLIPFFGLILAIPAVILGVLGLKKRKQNPLIRGVAHGWLGIVLGAISIIYHLLIIVAIISD
jgi:hypothetical protein